MLLLLLCFTFLAGIPSLYLHSSILYVNMCDDWMELMPDECACAGKVSAYASGMSKWNKYLCACVPFPDCMGSSADALKNYVQSKRRLGTNPHDLKEVSELVTHKASAWPIGDQHSSRVKALQNRVNCSINQSIELNKLKTQSSLKGSPGECCVTSRKQFT